MVKHGAIIKISVATFLKILDFEGGTIHSIKLNDEWFPQDQIIILLEHPDLPEINAGQMAEEIIPTFMSAYGDNGCILRIERIKPAKGNRCNTKK